MLQLQPSSFEEFAREAQRGNVVPVVRTVLADLHTPVSAFMRIAAGSPYSFLLESVEGGERVARYSFIGADPQMIVRGRAKRTVVQTRTEEQIVQCRATDFLRDYFRRYRLAMRTDLPPLAGGAVGYLAYDAAAWFEPILVNGQPTADECVLLFCNNVLTFDRVRQQILITSLVFTNEAQDTDHLRQLYDAAVLETERLEKALTVWGRATSPGVPIGPGFCLMGWSPIQADRRSAKSDPVFTSNWKQSDFESAVLQIKDHILAGDCYQVVLSQRFSRSVNADPLDIYRTLRTTNPSPYMFLLRLRDETLIGASPEMLVRCRGDQLEYRPIAGTRRRGASEDEDRRLADDLLADEKERAEHLMLVDLGRNDLGRVAHYGSVQVNELMSVERYSHVQHLVSGLRAQLRPEFDRFDALAACFPAGTVSGAPKIRAMQLIRELEPQPRGVYAGAVLYLDYGGNLDSCIAIRTLVLRDGCAYAQAGAGIVADSVPEREYEETVNKAAALLRAVELAEKGL
jgi:anthranilate synthase component 1